MDAVSESEECDECRICRGESTPEQPLSHPCRCAGSMRYVHEACLLHWLALSKARRCEARGAAALRCSDPALTGALARAQVCGVEFSYRPVYRADTPSRLPAHELLMGLTLRSARLARFAARVRCVQRAQFRLRVARAGLGA
jgi:E3 ubiquitin-protein ligase MARCH6